MHLSMTLGQSSLTSCLSAQNDPLLTYRAPSFQVNKYAHVEKKALSLIFSSRFHQFLYSNHFTLVTDHKPLTAILRPKKGIPLLVAVLMQRSSLLLSGFIYDICFHPTTAHGSAYCLSHLPLSLFSSLGNKLMAPFSTSVILRHCQSTLLSSWPQLSLSRY